MKDSVKKISAGLLALAVLWAMVKSRTLRAEGDAADAAMATSGRKRFARTCASWPTTS